MFLRYNLFAFLWAAAIFVLSVLPGKDLPTVEIVDFDLICHVLMYLVLVFLLTIGFIKQYDYYLFRYHPQKLAFSLCVLYGILIELIQHFFCEGRFFDIKDILANFIGCFMGSMIFSFIYYKA